VRLRFLLLAAVAAVAPAFADDGSTQLGAGGLVFARSADVRMAKEDLYVSPDKVRIRFEFVNDGPAQDVVIAFPLPDIDLEEQGDYGTLGKDPLNFVGFSTAVDGRKVDAKVEQKALLKGRDVTALVKAAGLPVNFLVAGGYDMLNALPAAKKAALAKEGLIDGDPQYPQALWTVQTRFYWTQHFAPGERLVIAHRYTPVTGGLLYGTTDNNSDLNKLYCIDPPMAAHLKAMSDNPAARMPGLPRESRNLLFGSLTDYILWTANSWKGPIGTFHLTLDKLDPRVALTLCWNGKLRKTSDTTFEYDAENFSPRQDIHMMVLK
jgi:uncharacterized protein DUF4424